MKCKRCKATAVVALPSHNTGFCAECFLNFFSKQVEKGIKDHNLFTHEDRILVALSGGKDSLALMLALGNLKYNITGLHIDLGIPESSPKARGVVERFCAQHGFPLIVKEMEAEGLAIPKVKQRLRRPICSACGKIKRYYFNKIAMDEGFTVLATGHNLDDEVARLFSNTIRWDTAYLSDQSPALEGTGSFSRKVKPLWRLSEYETANYAFLMNIEHHYAPCPYSKGASFTFYKEMWHQIEEKMPGRKIDFYQSFLEHGRPAFAAVEVSDDMKLSPCIQCGYPTISERCGVCRIHAVVNTDSPEYLETLAADSAENTSAEDTPND